MIKSTPHIPFPVQWDRPFSLCDMRIIPRIFNYENVDCALSNISFTSDPYTVYSMSKKAEHPRAADLIIYS